MPDCPGYVVRMILPAAGVVGWWASLLGSSIGDFGGTSGSVTVPVSVTATGLVVRGSGAVVAASRSDLTPASAFTRPVITSIEEARFLFSTWIVSSRDSICARRALSSGVLVVSHMVARGGGGVVPVRI